MMAVKLQQSLQMCLLCEAADSVLDTVSIACSRLTAFAGCCSRLPIAAGSGGRLSAGLSAAGTEGFM